MTHARLITIFAISLLGSPSIAISAPPQVIDISIVEVAGRPGHQGQFPIQGDPVAGTQAVARTRLSGPASNLSLILRDSSRRTISVMPITDQPATTLPPLTYYTSVAVPTAPFTMSVGGTDSTGLPFEVTAAAAPVFAPQTFALRLIPTVGEVPTGLPLFFTAQLTNYGPADTFTISLTSDAGGVVQPTSATISLHTSETAGVQFEYTAPMSLANVLGVTMTAWASSTSGRLNRAVLQLPVATQQPVALTVWTRPEERHDLVQRGSTTLVVSVCDIGIDSKSIAMAGVVAPTGVQTVAVGGANRKTCSAPTALELTFNAAELVSAIEASGLSPQRKRKLQIPINGFSLIGTPLIGYVSLLF